MCLANFYFKKLTHLNLFDPCCWVITTGRNFAIRFSLWYVWSFIIIYGMQSILIYIIYDNPENEEEKKNINLNKKKNSNQTLWKCWTFSLFKILYIHLLPSQSYFEICLFVFNFKCGDANVYLTITRHGFNVEKVFWKKCAF